MLLKTFKIVIVEKPKISAKMLCEYNETNASGRLAILKACKIKKPGVIAISRRYNEAEDLICTFMQHSFGFYSVLKDYSKELRKKGASKVGKEKENLDASADALEAFYDMHEKLEREFKNVTFEDLTTKRSHKFNLKSVTISIRPELTFAHEYETQDCGFVKLYFGKTVPLTNTIAENMALLGKYYFREFKKKDFKRENCIVIDVFAGKIYYAPKAEKRALKSLEACCDEIADRWDRIL